MKADVKKILIVILINFLFTGIASASLKSKINSLISQTSQKKVTYSIHIVKADTGRTVYRHNARTSLIPASNMKIIITAAALKYLGPDFEYKTVVGLCGDSLVVIGSGDPLLGDAKTDAKYNRPLGWVFEDIIAGLKKKNVTAVNDIIIDSTVFDDQRVHPNWPVDQLNKWYAAEVAGVNYNDNCIDMVVKNNGGKAVILIEPRTSFVKIVNQVRVMQNGKSAVGAYRNQQPNKIIVKGRCKKEQGPFPVTIERPAAFFGFLLAENLQKAGIKTNGKLIEKAVNRKFVKLAEYKTPVFDCLARSNKNSLQIAAEALYKTIAAKANPDGKNGSWEKGRDIISKYMSKLGIDQSEFYIDDGSGLSRENKLSANAVTRVLRDVYKSKNWDIYRDSLAIGGIDGTLARYFKEPKYKGNILGKTGYINRVRTFSGICTTQKGDYIFSILTNNNNVGRKVINDIAKAIIDEN